MCNKIFCTQIEKSYYRYNTSFKISDVQMDASTEGPVAAHEHPGTTIQMDTEAEGLAEEPE